MGNGRKKIALNMDCSRLDLIMSIMVRSFLAGG